VPSGRIVRAFRLWIVPWSLKKGISTSPYFRPSSVRNLDPHVVVLISGARAIVAIHLPVQDHRRRSGASGTLVICNSAGEMGCHSSAMAVRIR